ncbi:MAG TPA: membrane protein insertase YidC [candidate division Zixibacteria bacterium]|nr:membrane protein insertase YidC [candidate division Zixibacteria bacterium]
MDKRTVIGIIIIAAILILTPYYMKFVSGDPEPVAAEQTGEAETDRTSHERRGEVHQERPRQQDISPSGDTLLPMHSIGGEIDDALDTIPEKLVFVRTRHYDIELTTRGGDIKSFTSREFPDVFGEPMNFCHSEIVGPNFEVVAYRGREVISSAGLNFVVDVDTLVLNEFDDEGAVTFVAYLPEGGLLQRRYHFRYDDYAFEHTTLFAGDSAFDRLDETVLWWRKGLEPSDPAVKQNVSQSYRAGYYLGDTYHSEKFSSSESPRFFSEGSAGWVATLNKYFAVMIAPMEGYALGVRGDGVWYSSDKFDGSNRQIPAIGVGLSYHGGNIPYSRTDLVYIGPRDLKLLSEYGRKFEKAVDLGWRWLAPITKIFILIFDFLFGILGNYGFVIIVFSILIKIAFLPLSRKQMQSMKKMKDLQPKLDELKEKYATDVKKLNEETMKLYQKEKINPLGGCLPMIPQMPIFFALFAMLRNSFALRGAPFALWLTDLSAKDPYYILPILMGISMFIQQKLTMKDPKQKAMVYMMPLLFLFMFRNMPSGLVLYWLCFNIFSLAQTLWVEYKSKQESALAKA